MSILLRVSFMWCALKVGNVDQCLLFCTATVLKEAWCRLWNCSWRWWPGFHTLRCMLWVCSIDLLEHELLWRCQLVEKGRLHLSEAFRIWERTCMRTYSYAPKVGVKYCNITTQTLGKTIGLQDRKQLEFEEHRKQVVTGVRAHYWLNLTSFSWTPWSMYSRCFRDSSECLRWLSFLDLHG